MLKKFVAIKNVGRFINSAGPGNTQLAKHTFIAGANGYGKTTVCAVVRSLQTSDASHILGRKTLGIQGLATVDLLFDAGPVRFDGAEWKGSKSQFAIFDGVFVAENVHSGEVVEIDQKRNLYRVIIGEDGVKLAQADADFAAESRTKTSEITAVAKAIQPHVPGGMKVDAFIALKPDADVDALIAEQERTLEAARQADALARRAGPSEYQLPTLPAELGDVLARTIDDVAEDAERLLTTHLATQSLGEIGAVWIAQGTDHAGATCPFCGQSINGSPLIAAFKAVFSERYKALESDIATTKDKIALAFGEGALARIETVAEQNKSAADFWEKYCTFKSDTLHLPSDAISTAKEVGDAALALFDKKATSPLKSVSPDNHLDNAVTAYKAALLKLDAVNNSIRTLNKLIAEKKVEAAKSDVKAAETELARRTAVRARQNEAIKSLCDEHTTLTKLKDGIDKKKEQARSALDNHTKSVVKPYERRINDYLDAFNAGFSIAETKHGYPGGVATSSYQLIINKTAVELGDGDTPTNQPSFKNTLSAGDRTTLALSFFLAYFERDAALADRIVVFDDPFNSQDAFRRRQTIHEINKLAAKCAQVIVLSHDATFLKQLWDKAPTAERMSLTIADLRAQGSKIIPIDLEKACQGRTATDIDDLQTYLNSGAGALIDIIRKMRVVLETYCRTTYPTSFLAGDWLGDIVRKIREGGVDHVAAALYDELDQINAYTTQYHHGEDKADDTPDQIDPKELTGFAKRTLKIANALQA